MTNRFRLVAIVLALLAGLSACSRDDDSSSTSTSSDSNATSTAPESSSSTEPPTPTSTTDTQSSTTVDDVEAAIREVHTRFMTELWAVDELANGPEAALPLIEELTTGAQKRRMTEGIEQALESGERLVGPGYISNIVSVEIDGDRAFVDDCSLDRAELYSSEGELITPEADTFGVRTTVLVVVEGRWLVEDFWTSERECDPETQA